MHDAKFKFKTVKYEEEEKQYVIIDPNLGTCTMYIFTHQCGCPDAVSDG